MSRKIILTIAIIALIAGIILLTMNGLDASTPLSIIGAVLAGFGLYVVISAIIEHNQRLSRWAERWMARRK